MVHYKTRQHALVQKEKRDRILLNAVRAALLFSFLLGWEIAARMGVLNIFVFSSPTRVIQTISEWQHAGILLEHIGITMAETGISFFLVMLIGVISSVLLWCIPVLYRIIEPFLILINSLPKSALAPLFIVWLGNKPKTILVVAVSLAVFGCILTLYNAFEQIEPEKIKLIRSLNGTKYHIVVKVLLPACIPVVVGNMKVNIGLCLVGVIIGEFLAAKKGLGYLIIYGSQVFKMDWVVASIFILCVIAAILYVIISRMEKIIKNREA